MDSIINMIGNVGFPIVAYFLLWQLVVYLVKEKTKDYN